MRATQALFPSFRLKGTFSHGSIHTRKALISIGLTVLAVTFLMATQCYASPVVEVIGKTGSKAAEIEIHIPYYTNKALAQGKNIGTSHIMVNALSNTLCDDYGDGGHSDFAVTVLLKNNGLVAEGGILRLKVKDIAHRGCAYRFDFLWVEDKNPTVGLKKFLHPVIVQVEPGNRYRISPRLNERFVK